MTHPAPPGSSAALAELAAIDFADTDLDHVLALVADLAKRTLPGADEVSVTILRGEKALTPAATGSLAIEADELQYAQGHGPCLDAAATMGVLVVTDMAAETRWPDYTPRAVGVGIGSSISVGLPVQHELTGALNVYATRANAFAYDTMQLAVWLSGYAGVAVVNAARYADATRLADQMRQAMASRAVIEQAKGVLMAVQGCDADTAFALLTRTSQDSHRKLRDVAADIVERSARARAAGQPLQRSG